MKWQHITIKPSKTYRWIVGLCLSILAGIALADSDRLRRSNEARNLDLKIRQQQTLRQQDSFADRQRLEKRYDRQYQQQRGLQSRQNRRLYPSTSAPTKSIPKTDGYRRKGQIERFEREQRSQELGFKLDRSQRTQPTVDVDSKREDSTGFQWPFKER